MAWFSSGSTNTALISNLARNGLINSDRVKNAMLAVRALSPLIHAGFGLPLHTPDALQQRIDVS